MWLRGHYVIWPQGHYVFRLQGYPACGFKVITPCGCRVITSCAREVITSCAAGFKLDTLLRLADVKGTDKKTSLLAFVTNALLTRSGAATDIETLPKQLFSIKPAAHLQVTPPHSIVC